MSRFFIFVYKFFFPIKTFSIFLLIIGFFLFIFFFFKKRIKINFISLLAINFLILFISYNNDLAYDSMLYHLQTIKYNSNFKIILGLSNLEPRLGMNSSYHSLISIFNINLFNQNLIYFMNISIFSFFLNLIFRRNFTLKKKNEIFIYLSIVFILFYSLIHPWNNGTIMNNIGSPEVDIVSMIFFLLLIYLFLNLIEEKSEENFDLFIIVIFLLISFKLSYVYSLLLLLYIIFFKKILILNKTSFFVSTTFLIWIAKGLLLSGCILFPISKTCLNLSWSMGKENVEGYYNIVKSFNRTLPENTNFGNFEHTVQSYDWFVPWIKNYFLQTEFLIIIFMIFTCSILFLIIFFTIKKKNFLKENINIFFIIFFLFSLITWLLSPDIRLAYGLLIAVSILPLTVVLQIVKLNQLNKKIFKFSFILVLILLTFKQKNNINLLNNFPFEKQFNYQDFVKIYSSNNYNVFKPSKNVFCNFFDDFCSYQSLHVNIKEKNGYIIMTNNWQN